MIVPLGLRILVGGRRPLGQRATYRFGPTSIDLDQWDSPLVVTTWASAHMNGYDLSVEIF